MAASGLAAINFLREASRHFHAPAVGRAAANAGRPGLPYARAARRLPACNAGRPGLPYASLPITQGGRDFRAPACLLLDREDVVECGGVLFSLRDLVRQHCDDHNLERVRTECGGVEAI